jgi:hypothetical protein
MPTTSMSVRPLSAMARNMLRPMRPNPLMATRTVMSQYLSEIVVRGLTCARKNVSAS